MRRDPRTEFEMLIQTILTTLAENGCKPFGY